MIGIDAKLKRLDGGVYDIQIGFNGDVETEDSFDTAILVSLLTERRANESEVLLSHLRRGWIGNEHTPGVDIGSKLWLFDQSRLTRTVMNQIEVEAANALQWLVDNDLAVAVSASVTSTVDSVTLVVNIQRDNSVTERRFFELWNATGRS